MSLDTSWAENHIKVDACIKEMRRLNIAATTENLIREYIKQGGRVVTGTHEVEIPAFRGQKAQVDTVVDYVDNKSSDTEVDAAIEKIVGKKSKK